jgi:hypothetical protein
MLNHAPADIPAGFFINYHGRLGAQGGGGAAGLNAFYGNKMCRV